VFVTELFEAVMQGKETEKSVIEALDRIAGNPEKFDAVVIIRGGGSTTDLSWFDSYDLSYHITQFPIPVLTGIGHEKDLSVADMVACKALKTPTAVADFLVGRTAETENHIIEMASAISHTAAEMISEHEEQLKSLQNHIASSARIILRVKRERLGYFSDTLNRITNSALRISNGLIEILSKSLNHLDPGNILKRGFTLTAKNGRIIRSSKELSEDDKITTHFTDGKVTSVIIKKEN